MNPLNVNNFKPVQLFSELDSYKSFVTPMHDPLYGFVQEMYQFDLSDTLEHKFFCLPDACTDLIFFINSSQADSILLGNFPRADFGPLKNCVYVFGMRFFIGAYNAFFNIPAHEFIKEAITPTKEILDADVLGELLGTADTFEERVKVCRGYLTGKMPEGYTIPAVVRYSVASILINNGDIRISEMANDMGYSERYIRRMFNHYIGISPKTLCEIVKFQAAMAQYISNPNINMEQLAFDNGYYDLAHFYKSFRGLTGNAPRSLMKKQALI